jgi:hypothetical protein
MDTTARRRFPTQITCPWLNHINIREKRQYLLLGVASAPTNRFSATVFEQVCEQMRQM